MQSPHLSNAALEQHADVSWAGQDVHAGDAAQEHGRVDVEALGLARRGAFDLTLLVHLQGAVLVEPAGRHAVPLSQRHRLLAPQHRLACQSAQHIAVVTLILVPSHVSPVMV